MLNYNAVIQRLKEFELTDDEIAYILHGLGDEPTELANPKPRDLPDSWYVDKLRRGWSYVRMAAEIDCHPTSIKYQLAQRQLTLKDLQVYLNKR